MKITVLPMDNRPPNYKFLKELATIYNLNIELPPENRLGFYMSPGNMEWLKDWLVKQSGDVFIISTEMLCYGGLIASRENWNSYSGAAENLSAIEKIKERNPNSKILLSSIIRRASISVFSSETRDYWEEMNEYLKNMNGGALIKKEKSIPVFLEKYVDEYWTLRERNHKINRDCIEYVKRGIAEVLVLAQEDTFENGPQVKEIEILSDLVNGNGPSEKVFIHNGADEVLQELLIRSFNSTFVDLFFDSEKTKNKVMDFEDRSFKKNVESHMKLTGFRKDKNSGVSILISGSEPEKTKKLIKKMDKSKEEIYLLDVFKANGSNPELIDQVISEKFERLLGFSAWNTASNSLGTLLCMAAGKEDKSYLNLYKFFMERLVDDHLYQGIYRDKLENSLIGNNEDIYKVRENSKIFSKFRDEIFFPEANRFLKNNFLNKKIIVNEEEYVVSSVSLDKFSLPWNRSFECSVDVNISFNTKGGPE